LFGNKRFRRFAEVAKSQLKGDAGAGDGSQTGGSSAGSVAGVGGEDVERIGVFMN